MRIMNKTALKLAFSVAISVACCGCGNTRIGGHVKNDYINELAVSADHIVLLSKKDKSLAKLKAISLQEKMCAYVAGLEAAGMSSNEIQSHINSVGDRLGAAFSLAAE
jgi:hypothetical protein